MKNVFVHTSNVKNFMDAMKEAEKVHAEPVLLTFHGEAGRGKTSAARFFSAQEGWTYVRALRGWSELWMLQDLCFELRVDPVPKQKKRCFEAIKARLWETPKAVLIDEADKLSDNLIEWVRDLADLTFVPFALIGEKLVMMKMQKEKRVWSRTLRAIEFTPITTKDILFFAKQAAEMALNADQAEQVRTGTGGDFRLVSRVIRKLEDLSSVNQPGKITDEMVKVAVKQGLWGR